MSRPTARLAAVVVLALSILTATAVAASAVPFTPTGRYVYWTGYQGSVIQRADAGGGPVETIWSSFNTTPTGVAVDRTNGDIYWSTRNTVDIYTSEADGSNAHTLNIGSAEVSQAFGIAIDANARRVYWANYTTNTISWAAMDGSGDSGQLNLGAAPINGPQGIAIDSISGKVFWANSNTSGDLASGGWAMLDNSGIAGSLGDGGFGDYNVGMAFSPHLQRVIWSEYNTNQVFSSTPDGGSRVSLTSSPASIDGAAGTGIDEATGRVYVAAYDGQQINYLNADGSGDGGTFASGLSDVPYGNLAVSGSGALIASGATPTASATLGSTGAGILHLTNTGNYPIELFRYSFGGVAGFGGGTGCASAIGVGESCDLTFTYSPPNAADASATLKITTDAGDFSFPVRGVALANGGNSLPGIDGLRAQKRCAASATAGSLSISLFSNVGMPATVSLQRSSTRRRTAPTTCPPRATNSGYMSRALGKKTSKNRNLAAGKQTATLKQMLGTNSLTPGRYRLLVSFKAADGSTVSSGTWFWVTRK